MMIQIRIQIRQWKQVATQTSTTLQRELTLRKTHNSRPRSQRPRGKAAQCPCPQRINADKGHRSVRTTTQKELHFSICACHLCAGCMQICSVSFHGRSTNACHPHARAVQFSPYYKGRGQKTSGTRSALRPASLIEKKPDLPPIPTFSNYVCHPCTVVMPSASNSRRVITQAKKKKVRVRNSLVLQTPNTHQRLLKHVWNAIPVQIDSIHSHGERSGNPYQPGSPGANDRVQYRTHFRAVIHAKYSACFLLDACHGDLIQCVLEGFIPFLRGCPHIASIRRSAPGRCESECFQGSRACPITMTPILFPATMLLAEHAPEGNNPNSLSEY